MGKSEFTDCTVCSLYTQGMVVGETNVQDDLSKARVIVLAEAPANDELKQGRPLIGRAGKIFREAFTKSGLDKIEHYIGNVVFCANIQNGKTKNPPEDAIEKCKPNWQKLIDIIQPELILVMGSVPMKVLGIGDTGITKKRGGFYKYNDIDVMLTIHPSFVQRNGGIGSDKWGEFFSDFESAVAFLSIGDVLTDGPKLDKPRLHRIPEKYYSEDYVLMDIQYMSTTNEVLYIFRDKDNNKEYYKEMNNAFYFYYKNESQKESPMLSSIKDVNIAFGKKYKAAPNLSLYESDVHSEAKYMIDYRIQKKNERDVKPKIMYCDIEVFLNMKKGFPYPQDAKFPINSISLKIDDGKTFVLLTKLPKMDTNKIKEFPGRKIMVYSSEKKMLLAFCAAVRKSDIDIMTGWNFVGFDLPTILNRMKKLGIDINLLSPVDAVKFNPNRYGDFQIYGYHVLDMLELYKELTQQVEESYKLNYVAKKNLGETKVAYEGTLDELYMKDINTFVDYSAVDTELLKELDAKVGHIRLKFEMVKICSSSWKTCESTTGLLDPLVISFAKNKGLVCRNSLNEESDRSIPGAFVMQPKKGIHSWLADFDYASLYPRIICTFNIGPNTFIGKLVDNDKDFDKASELFNRTAFRFLYDNDEIAGRDVELYLNPMSPSRTITTMNWKDFNKWLQDNDAIVTVAGTIYKGHNQELSFLNEVVSYLMNTRTVYKKEMSDAELNKNKEDVGLFFCMQMAYKILANALYGVLANQYFRFFNLEMAESITLTGRESIQFAGQHLSDYMREDTTTINNEWHYGYEEKKVPYIAYTDTDSIFVQMGEYLMDKGIL